jgi:hypothetical protein
MQPRTEGTSAGAGELRSTPTASALPEDVSTTFLPEECETGAQSELDQLKYDVDVLTDPLIGLPSGSTPHASEAAPAAAPRRAVSPDPDILRAGIRTVLGELERKASEMPSSEQEQRDRTWLEDVGSSVLREHDFIAGGFGRHLAAWEELLRNSNRTSSKKVLRWLRQGVTIVLG